MHNSYNNQEISQTRKKGIYHMIEKKERKKERIKELCKIIKKETKYREENKMERQVLE